MKNRVFYEGLNEFCRKYLVTNSKVTISDLLLFDVERKNVEATLFENLLLFDTVFLKVHGENIPLAVLLSLLGEKRFEELLEQNSINFVLWTPSVVHMLDTIKGVDPIAAGNFSSEAHCDPEKSIELGFNWMTKKPLRSKRRMLTRKLRDRFILPDESLPHTAVGLTQSAYSSGKLDKYGFSHKKTNIRELKLDERAKLCTCATDLLEYNFLLSNQMTSYSKKAFYDFFNDSKNKLEVAEARISSFYNLAKLESFPDLKTLYQYLDEPFKLLPKLRNKNSSIKFRKWLSEVTDDSNVNSEITKEYIDAIANSKGLFETKTGKITKTVVMSGIGAGIGSVLAGPIGGVAGASVGKILEPAADMALDLVDEFLLDGLTKGWTPRIFFDDLEKIRKLDKASKNRRV